MADEATLTAEAPASPADTAAAAPAAAAPAGTLTGDAPADDAAKVDAEGKPIVEAPKEGEGDKPATEEKPQGEEAPGAPETYEDFKAPEGVTLDPEVTGELKTLAKELNLPQEKAQAVADLGVKLVEKWQEAHTNAAVQLRNDWKDQTVADPEIGGANLEASVADAKKGLAFAASPALKELLEGSGLGNHPEIIRAFAKVGKAISEDKVRTGNGSPTGQPKSLAQRLYPDQA